MKKVIAYIGTFFFGLIIGGSAGNLDTIFIALLSIALGLIWGPIYFWLISDSDPQ